MRAKPLAVLSMALVLLTIRLDAARAADPHDGETVQTAKDPPEGLAAPDDQASEEERKELSARADEAFREGRRLLTAHDFARACPKLEESFALEPATGSLLALGICHEGQSRLASAVREYSEVERRSVAEKRPDRAAAARTRRLRIEPRISQLVLHGGPDVSSDGYRVQVNGTLLEPSRLEGPIFVDGGYVLIEARQDGRKPFAQRIFVAPQRDRVEFTLPDLEPLPVPEPVMPLAPAVVAAPKQPPKPQERRDAEAERLTRQRWTGIALLGAGAASSVVALAFTVRAVRKDADSDAGCIDDACTPGAREDRLSAHRAGNAATIALATAVGLTAAGLGVYLHARQKDRRRSDMARLRGSLWADRGAGGVVLRGGF